MTYTRYEIAVNDKSNRFENRIELEELIAKAIQSYGLKVGVDGTLLITVNWTFSATFCKSLIS